MHTPNQSTAEEIVFNDGSRIFTERIDLNLVRPEWHGSAACARNGVPLSEFVPHRLSVEVSQGKRCLETKEDYGQRLGRLAAICADCPVQNNCIQEGVNLGGVLVVIATGRISASAIIDDYRRDPEYGLLRAVGVDPTPFGFRIGKEFNRSRGAKLYTYYNLESNN
jgi:hypothetical protein